MRILLTHSLFLGILCYCIPGTTLASGLSGYTENKGQIIDQDRKPNTKVKYLFHSKGLNIQLHNTGFSFDTYKITSFKKSRHLISQSTPGKFSLPADSNVYHFHRIDVNFTGCNSNPQIVASEVRPGYTNYYTSGTPAEGVQQVFTYGKVTYFNLYERIDLEFTTDSGGLNPKYNFIIHPGADISQIRWHYEGANQISLENGKIRLTTGTGFIEEEIPESFEETTYKKVEVQYIPFNHNEFGYLSALSNNTYPLIIDPLPKLFWSTYFGGEGQDFSNDIISDSSDNIYITGSSSSTNNIATSGAFQTVFSGGLTMGDIFVAKLSENGTKKWCTYLGGNGNDRSVSVVLDEAGNIYLTGETQSASGFATSGAHQTTYGGFYGYGDAFLIKLSNDGIRQWATYYGGASADMGFCITTDHVGNLLVTGMSMSNDNIATIGAYQEINGGIGQWDAFLAKFSDTGTLLWGTFYGGPYSDFGNAVVVDSINNIYLAGQAVSISGIASDGAYQTYNMGSSDNILVKFAPDGTRLWGTFYGGADYDNATDLILDEKTNSVFLTGYTYSATHFALNKIHQDTIGGKADGFLAKFSTSGIPSWCTYIGGEGDDAFTSVTIDVSSNIYLTGSTQSRFNIADSNVIQPQLNDSSDALIIKFNKDGVKQWGTYYGGARNDFANAIYTNGTSGYMHVTGGTSSFSGFTTTGAPQSIFGGDVYDGFILKTDLGCPPKPVLNTNGNLSFCQGDSLLLKIKDNKWSIFQWVNDNHMIQSAHDSVFISKASGEYYLNVSTPNGCKDHTDSVNILVHPLPPAIINQGSPISFCEKDSIMLTSNYGQGLTYTWMQNNIPVAGSNKISFHVKTSGVYAVKTTDSNNCQNISQPVLADVHALPSTRVEMLGDTILCLGQVLALYADTIPGLSYQWLKNKLPLSGETKQGYAVRTTGYYQIALQNLFGCSDTSQPVLVTVYPLPDVSITPSGTINKCMGDSVILRAGSGNNLFYLWKKDGLPIPNEQAPFFVAKSTGNYRLLTTDAKGCTDSSTDVVVTMLNLPETDSILGPIRVDQFFSYVYSAPQQSGFSYEWFAKTGLPIDGQGNSSIKIKWMGVGNTFIKLEVSDQNGCKNSTQVPVFIQAFPFNTKKEFSVFPNPVINSDSITVISSVGLDESIYVITDIIGRKIAEGKFTGIHPVYKIPTEYLSYGTYILNIKGLGISHLIKFVRM